MDQSVRAKKTTEKNQDQKVPYFLRVSKPTNVLFNLLFLVLSVVAVTPAVLCFMISISSENSINTVGYSFIPAEFSTTAYRYLWEQKATIGLAGLVSIFVAVAGMCVGLFLNTTLAYTLSRPTYRLKGFFTVMILIPMLFSGGMVASYMIVAQFLGLRNTLWALILPMACSSFYIVVLRTFFQTTVPDAIIESGKIDGAPQLRIFFQIVLPISLPAIATIGLFLVFGYWNDWFQALLYLDSNHRNLYPLQYVLVSIQRNLEFLSQNPQASAQGEFFKNIPSETMRMAIVMVIVVPIACAYPFFQRYFVTGLTIGAVKG